MFVDEVVELEEEGDGVGDSVPDTVDGIHNHLGQSVCLKVRR